MRLFKLFSLLLSGIFFVSSTLGSPLKKVISKSDSIAVEEAKTVSIVDYVELKEKIASVQNETNNKFSIFLWSASTIVTLLIIIVGISFFNNKTIAAQNAKETARDEFVREYKVYKRKFNEMLKDIKSKKEEIENMKFEIEQYQAAIQAASIASQNITVENENGKTNNTNATKA